MHATAQYRAEQQLQKVYRGHSQPCADGRDHPAHG